MGIKIPACPAGIKMDDSTGRVGGKEVKNEQEREFSV